MNTVQNPNGRLITFNETLHKYTDELGNVYTSTTTLIGKYKPEFDKDFWAEKKAKDYGITKEEVIANWDRTTKTACDNGNAKHNYLEDNINISTGYVKKKLVEGKFEMYTLDEVLENPNLGLVSLEELAASGLEERYPKIYKMVTYLTKIGYRFYAEICVYSYKHLVSGAIDLLAIKFDDNFKPVDGFILDWKTNKEVIKSIAGYYKKDKHGNYIGNFTPTKSKLLFPLNHMADCKLSLYGMQLNTYAHMCELRGFPIKMCILYHIRSKEQIKLTEHRDIDDDEEVVEIEVPNYRYEVTLMFSHHYTTRLKDRAVQTIIKI